MSTDQTTADQPLATQPTAAQQRVYLITETQREALLSYLQERPYREVAAGIQFLMNAPTAVLNVLQEGGRTSATINPLAAGDQGANGPISGDPKS